MASVKIKNVMAVRYIQFEMPENEGGVRLFTGENGAGKSTALACLNALLGQKVNLSPSDDAPKGEIEGLGAHKTIGKTVRSQGDPDVPNLEGRFSFSDLVDPSVKDPAARNKSRIRALVGLTAKGCSEADFHELFGGEEEFNQIVVDEDGELFDVTDVLEMADKIKRIVQGRARLEESRQEAAEIHWQNAVEMSKGHRPDAPPESVADLASKYSAAKNAMEAARAVHRQSETATERNGRVEQLVAKHSERKPAREPAAIGKQLSSCKSTVAELEKRLEVARAAVAKLQLDFDAAIRWEEQLIEIESTRMDVPDELPELEPLEAAEKSALAALETAEEVKQRWEAAVNAKKFADEIKQRRTEAERLRVIAGKTNEVVTKLLPKGPLEVRDGMLCAFHEGRGKLVDYDSLSTGERWEAALDVAIAVVGEGGVIPVSQEGWQGLDEESRKHVAKRCKAAKVWLVSAEVADGPLAVTEYTAG